jgi:hypothetical protein
MSRDCAIKMPGYGADDRNSTSGSSRTFSPGHHIQVDARAKPVSYPVGIFTRGQNGRTFKLTSQPPSSAESKMRGSLPPCPCGVELGHRNAFYLYSEFTNTN